MGISPAFLPLLPFMGPFIEFFRGYQDVLFGGFVCASFLLLLILVERNDPRYGHLRRFAFLPPIVFGLFILISKLPMSGDFNLIVLPPTYRFLLSCDLQTKALLSWLPYLLAIFCGVGVFLFTNRKGSFSRKGMVFVLLSALAVMFFARWFAMERFNGWMYGAVSEQIEIPSCQKPITMHSM